MTHPDLWLLGGSKLISLLQIRDETPTPANIRNQKEDTVNMADHAGNPFYAHHEAGAKSYESINNFKKDITREVLKLYPPLDMNSVVLENACAPTIVTSEI
jgi:hypothetical protein